MLYDGVSLALMTFALAIYGISMIAGISSLSPDDIVQPLYITLFRRAPIVKQTLPPSRRVETISIICACNTLILVALVGVILLQCGDWIVERSSEKARQKADEQVKQTKTQ